MERGVYISLGVLFLVGLVDSISYMAVAPSLIFYVTALGGTKEQYGLIMSAFSFASFCFKPIYGYWVDATGNQYKIPFVASFTLAIFGNIVYWLAIILPKGTPAVYCILVARLFAGMGAANNTLAFSYLATMVPFEKQTTFNVLLSMSRIVGMTMGPIVNLALARVDTEFHLGKLVILMTPYNSVGLFVAAGNVLVLLVTFIFMQEPPVQKKGRTERSQTLGLKELWKALACLDIMLPLLVILVANCNFQMIEAAFPPAAFHGLGWGPVQTSTVMGINAIAMFFLMVTVMFLSMNRFSDNLLVAIGNVFWIVGGSCMYILWTADAKAWHYVLPFFIGVAGFPFIAPSNRSLFTLAVASIPELEGTQAAMQSLLSMAASVAGFLTPTLVAIFVLRNPADVDSGNDKHELTIGALYVPIGSGVCIALMWYQNRLNRQKRTGHVPDGGGGAPSEETSLVSPTVRASSRRSSVIAFQQTFANRSERARRHSVEIMNISIPYENADESEYRKSLRIENKEWESLATLMDVEVMETPKSNHP